jgi:ornithine carbamoyltransferase
MEFVAATPEGYEPTAAALGKARACGGNPTILRDARDAAAGANVLYTDTWTSMGQEAEREQRLRDFEGHRVDGALLALADPEAIVLHCLPAHVGDEITEDVLYGPQCAAWDEAENRLHTEKALLALIVE